MSKIIKLSTVSLIATCGVAVTLSGCATSASLDPITQTTSTGSNGPSGRFTGGQQAVAGVSMQLYAVGTTGYGSAANPLLTPGAVKTTASGNFTLPTFTCPTPTSLVYLVGTGGTPIGGSANSNLALMAVLGQCQNASSFSFISVNELTTVAATWALSPFMTAGSGNAGYANIGSSSTNALGIANAFATATNLVNTVTGQIVVPNYTASNSASLNYVTGQKLNEIADILANCVNSAGSDGVQSNGLNTGNACDKLFFITTPTVGSAPTDTITAAMNLAQLPATTSPSTFPTYLDDLKRTDVYVPYLTSAPNDFTIGVNYTGGGLSQPTAIALDQTGNVWVTNGSGNSVTQLSNTGTAATGSPFTAGLISSPVAIAVDLSGNAWVANSGASITELNPTGSSGINYTGNGLSTPSSIAVDGLGNVWVANKGAGLSAFTSTGSTLPGSPFSGGGESAPVSIAISPK